MFASGSAPPPSRPPTPVPKFRYLDDPKAYGRSYAHRHTPFEGDFCVVSIDHVASIADLGPEAMEAAKRIPSALYVAYIGMSLSLPFESHPTNPFTIPPICQGIPSESTLCDDTPACIPILPNAGCFGERQPLKAVAPFPWPDCYVSTFTARSCRVTNAKRDYSHVLCVPIDKVNARANGWIFKGRSFLDYFEERREQGDPEALARRARSLSPVESYADPLYFLPPLPSASCPDAAITTDPDMPEAEAIIEGSSTPGDFGGTPAFNPAEFPPEAAVYGALASAMFNTGRPDQPIVNIWYNLDMVSEVRDPQSFVSEYDMLERLRMHYHPERVAERARAAADAESHFATKAVPEPDTTLSSTSTAPTIARGTASALCTTSVAQHPTSRRFFAALAAKATSNILATGTQESLRRARSSSSRYVYPSTLLASSRSLKDSSASYAWSTRGNFAKHPHPYATYRPMRSASTFSYAVPRTRHHSLKSLIKSPPSSVDDIALRCGSACVPPAEMIIFMCILSVRLCSQGD